ncbi:MAG: 50S ribosomal protein L25 [Actinomycetota bacterium]|jgi:large subunit ribosomal protein L25|nr:50S ribosomal protein L25 [Actinomycetota bacterium]
MTETVSITVSPRTIVGKANRHIGPEGLIPAVVYGAGRESIPVSVSRHDFELTMSHHALGATVIKLVVEGESEPVNTVVKDMQTSPVKGNVIHIDFMAINMNEKLQASVPLHLVGDSVGVKAGGVVMHNMHDVLVEALPSDLPSVIEVDITDLEVGSNLHASDIVAPAGVTIVDDAQALVCSVTTPMAEVEEEALEGEEAAEPELIGESDDEESEEA